MDEGMYIGGKNAVREALKANAFIDKLYVAIGTKGQAVDEIIELARKKGIPVQLVSKDRLNEFYTGKHQGIVAKTPPYVYKEVEDILDMAKERNEVPFVIILDGIQDPNNLGSVLRTADACGAHGVIIPKNRAVGITPGVIKASAGAIQYVPVARVTNITTTLKELKKMGLWIIGADLDGDINYYNVDFKDPLGIVIGSEGYGMSRLVKENCDILVKIPMFGKINSLNASIASAVLMYEVVRQRNL